MREYQARFCERFRGETPLYLLDFCVTNLIQHKIGFRKQISATTFGNNFAFQKFIEFPYSNFRQNLVFHAIFSSKWSFKY